MFCLPGATLQLAVITNFILVTIASTAIGEPVASEITAISRHLQFLLERSNSPVSATFQSQEVDSEIYHLVNVEVGTPPQSLQIRLSAIGNFWVPDAHTSLCAENACKYGSFNKVESGTYQESDISFHTGMEAVGGWFNDTVSVNGLTLTEFNVGLVNTSRVPIGQLGLSVDDDSDLFSFVRELKTSGEVCAEVFSLFLGSVQSRNGALLFGAVDQAKYTGDLIAAGYDAQGALELTHIELSQSNFTVGSFVAVAGERNPWAQFRIDVQRTYLPRVFVESMMETLNATILDDYGPVVACDALDKHLKLVFQFAPSNGARIEIAFSEMLRPAMNSTDPLTTDNGQPLCQIDVWSIDSWIEQNNITYNSYLILGESFIKHAYMVYSFDARHLALAQANLDTNYSRIVTATNGSIPGAITPTYIVSVSMVATATVGHASGTLRTDDPALSTSPALESSSALSITKSDILWTITLLTVTIISTV